MSIAGTGSDWGKGASTGSGDPTTRDPIKKVTVGPSEPLKTQSQRPEKERVYFRFNPTADEAWRSDVAPVLQLYAAQIMSREEARERLKLGPVRKEQTFAPMPTQMTPGQANKITTDPRTSAGLQNPKGITSKPPEQQEKPKERKWKVSLDSDDPNNMLVTESHAD